MAGRRWHGCVEHLTQEKSGELHAPLAFSPDRKAVLINAVRLSHYNLALVTIPQRSTIELVNAAFN